MIIWQQISGNEPFIYCRADEGKWKQVSRWTWESRDWDRWKSLRASGGQVENGTEGTPLNGDLRKITDRKKTTGQYEGTDKRKKVTYNI